MSEQTHLTEGQRTALESIYPREPRLWPGHKVPSPTDRPVYWMMWILDDNGKPYHSRMANSKHMDPQSAYNEAYGRGRFTRNVLFFNCTSRITECRKMVREIAELWRTEAWKTLPRT